MVSEWLAPVGGALVLALVCAFCAALAGAARVNAAALPLPVLAGCVLVLLGFGYAGWLHGGLMILYGVLAGATALLAWRAGRAQIQAALTTPGFLFFAAAGLFFWVLLAVNRPQFTQWDEFTFWGAAAKMLKEQNMLYCAAPGNLQARAGLPAMALLSYFFQGASAQFSEWQCLAAYDILFMACLAAAAALPRHGWSRALAVLGCGVLLPYFFSVYTPGAPSVIYQNAMADVPLALLFGGSISLWFALKGATKGGEALRICAVALTLGLLTATKDMGFAYAMIAVFALFCAELAGAQKPLGRFFGKTLGKAALLAVPVLGVFLSWSRYYAAVAGGAHGGVGSAGLGYGEILTGGLAQFFGVGRTETFGKLMELMGRALWATPVCLLGGGAAALAVIALTAVLAWLCAEKGAARRCVLACWAALAFGFAGFYLFHLILYYYNFAEIEALQLKDYARYIGPYYQGWELAMLALLARGAVFGRQKLRRWGAAALGAAAVCFAVVFAWRAPATGVWQNPASLYELRQDVGERAAAANDALTWSDRVLIISQGDDATRWYYYNYELHATVVGWYGGDNVDNSWASEFANLVESLNWKLYDYQAVCTPAMLVKYLREQKCDYLLVDRADAYLQREFSDLFEGGLTADMPATLYRVQDTGAAMYFVPAVSTESGVVG